MNTKNNMHSPKFYRFRCQLKGEEKYRNERFPPLVMIEAANAVEANKIAELWGVLDKTEGPFKDETFREACENDCVRLSTAVSPGTEEMSPLDGYVRAQGDKIFRETLFPGTKTYVQVLMLDGGHKYFRRYKHRGDVILSLAILREGGALELAECE